MFGTSGLPKLRFCLRFQAQEKALKEHCNVGGKEHNLYKVPALLCTSAIGPAAEENKSD